MTFGHERERRFGPTRALSVGPGTSKRCSRRLFAGRRTLNQAMTQSAPKPGGRSGFRVGFGLKPAARDRLPFGFPTPSFVSPYPEFEQRDWRPRSISVRKCGPGMIDHRAEPHSLLPMRSAIPCPHPTTVRRIIPAKKRNFGRIFDEFPVPDLTQIQTRSYERFLQADLPDDKRGDAGLEGVFREIFPIESYDKTLKLEYLHYDLGKPRYDPDECRQLRLTYGRPLHVWLRLNKGETTLEESVYLGDMPIMIGGGEFIINGAERVVVSQLHRSPGVDFVVEIESNDKKLHACRVIPERGSWIELQVTKKDTLGVRIDQSGKFSSMTLLRAMSPQYSSDEAILQSFYEVEEIDSADSKAATKLEGRIACGDIVDPSTGEVLADSGTTISKALAQVLADAGNLGTIPVLKDSRDPLILQSLQEDPTTDHESALLRIYQRLRPGNPPQLEKARELFHEKFFDTNRYRLGKVGRFRINRKFNQDIPEDRMTLAPKTTSTQSAIF